jgi:hypothetical protein
MPLKLLLDENLRHEAIWSALNSVRGARLVLDVVRVGDAGAPDLGTGDPELIAWAAAENRIIVSLDEATLVRDLSAFQQSGRHSPGAIILRHGLAAAEVAVLLELVAYDSAADDWANSCQWLP